VSRELRDVRRRLRGTREIRHATHALQKVAATRLVPQQDALLCLARYVRGLEDALRAAGAAAPETAHPLTAERPAGALAVVIFGSDRGLCGGFNTQLAERLTAFRRAHAGDEIRLLVSGRIVWRRVRRLGLPVERLFPQPRFEPARGGTADESLEPLIRAARTGFAREDYRAVYLLYARFRSVLSQEPVVERLLPARPPGPDGQDRRVAVRFASEFDPGPAQIAAAVLDEWVRSRAHLAFLSSLASENAMRQAAMSRATENAGELIEELLKGYRRLRQENITTEMLEIAAGRVG